MPLEAETAAAALEVTCRPESPSAVSERERESEFMVKGVVSALLQDEKSSDTPSAAGAAVDRRSATGHLDTASRGFMLQLSLANHELQVNAKSVSEKSAQGCMAAWETTCRRGCARCCQRVKEREFAVKGVVTALLDGS